MAREWLKCFRAVYYQQVQNVQFLDEINGIQNRESYISEARIKNKRKSLCTDRNKENENSNICSLNWDCF